MRIDSRPEFLKSDTIENDISPITLNEASKINQMGISSVQTALVSFDHERFASNTATGITVNPATPQMRQPSLKGWLNPSRMPGRSSSEMMRGSATLKSVRVAPGPNSIETIPSHQPKLASVNGSRCSRVSESPLRTMCNPRMLVTSRYPESASILIISEQR